MKLCSDLSFSEMKELDFNILNLPLWKDLLSIIAKNLDFRDLLIMNITCKNFKLVSLREISRRNIKIKETGEFYSDKKNWYLGRRCIGFSLLKELTGERIKYSCGKWEEICTLGDYNLCRSCKNKRSIENRKYKQEYTKQVQKELNASMTHFWDEDIKRTKTDKPKINRFRSKNE